jgi:hypothetical protein
MHLKQPLSPVMSSGFFSGQWGYCGLVCSISFDFDVRQESPESRKWQNKIAGQLAGFLKGH